MVAASGESLTEEIAEALKDHHVIAVNDAYLRVPFADVLYACDAKWWDIHCGCPEFEGERWSSHGPMNHKLETAEKYGLNLVAGEDKSGFSLNPHAIHYGRNSGFQAVNLAILMGAKRIALVGFDMKGGHFFGRHPEPLRNDLPFGTCIRHFQWAARRLPEDIQITNCTPGSALKCFPMGDIRSWQ